MIALLTEEWELFRKGQGSEGVLMGQETQLGS